MATHFKYDHADEQTETIDGLLAEGKKIKQQIYDKIPFKSKFCKMAYPHLRLL